MSNQICVREWWNSAGTGSFFYGGHFSAFSGEDPGLPFLYRQSVTTPSKYQLKIQHWGYNVDLLMDYDSSTGVVKVASESWTGASHATYGDIYVMDYNEWLVKYIGGSASADFNGHFDEEKGIITLCTIYIDYVDTTDIQDMLNNKEQDVDNNTSDLDYDEDN